MNARKKRKYKISSWDRFVFRDPETAVKILKKLDEGMEHLEAIHKNFSSIREDVRQRHRK